MSGAARPAAWLGLALLLAGASLSARALERRGRALAARALVARAWEEALRSGREVRPWPWADTYPVALLQIPSVGCREVVLEGAGARVLAFGPGRMPEGARPGEAGNLLVAGHRTGAFRPLENVRPGAAVFVDFRDARGPRRRTYRVTEVRVIDPADTSFLAQTPEDALTLVTCFPFGAGASSPLRWVVRAWAEGPSGAVLPAS